MDWQMRLEAALDYLERHLEGEADLGKAAAAANCSTFHFLRMFAVVTGTTVGDYLRRRRLSVAAQALHDPDAKVIDLALRYGYDSPDAFAKAFKREFGLAPSEVRSGRPTLKYWPRLGFTIVLKGDVAMEFRIEQHPEFKFVGLARRFTTDDGANFRGIPPFWQEAMRDGATAKLDGARRTGDRKGVMGICLNDWNDKDRSFSYMIGVDAAGADRSKLPAGCVEAGAPAGTWAIFPCRGPVPDAIQAVWKRIYAEWFPNSGYEAAASAELEVYGEDDPATGECYSEVWIPVRKAAR
jgi:AraC family transcriptional regulator